MMSKVLSWFRLVRELRRVADHVLAEGRAFDASGVWARGRTSIHSPSNHQRDSPTSVHLVGFQSEASATGLQNNVQLGFLPFLEYPIFLTYALLQTSDWIGDRLRSRVA